MLALLPEDLAVLVGVTESCTLRLCMCLLNPSGTCPCSCTLLFTLLPGNHTRPVDTEKLVYGHANEKGLKKIHKAAIVGDVPRVQELLLRQSHYLNDVDWRLRTALHFAAAHGHKDVVALLVDRECDLNLRDYEKRTALMK
ncbi:Ankyrin repeat domain-containing protein 26, partial [Galemys pyrenaicus]